MTFSGLYRIWGCLKLPVNNPIENLHMLFCKHLLGVQRHTSNTGVLLEVGRVPITLNAQKAAVKNWERIRNLKANYLLTMSHENAQLESLEWLNKINICLAQNGMFNFVTEKSPFTPNIHIKLFRRAKDIFHQTAFSSMSDVNCKLRTYNLVKKQIGTETYLQSIRNVNYRVSLSKFRLSNHKLMIEIGRHLKLPKSERLCHSCVNEIEDEIHFLIKCDLYTTHRKPLFESSLEVKPNFLFYSDQEKFVFIMTCTQLSNVLAKFIHTAMKIRISTCHDI